MKNQTFATRYRLPALLAVVLLGCLASPDTCAAQARKYRPSSPTVSPYLNLTRPNIGPLPNYYSLVRPQQVQRSINLQERRLREQQSRNLLRLQNDIQVGLAPLTPTGSRSRFLFDGGRTGYLQTRGFYSHPAAIHRSR